MSDTENTVDTSTTYLGRVKWFNNRAGFGFATVMEGEKRVKIFSLIILGFQLIVNNTSILFKENTLHFFEESDNDKHPYQAGDIKGVAGGPLMCETKNEQRQQQSEYESENSRTKSKQSAQGRWKGRSNRWRSSKKQDNE